MSRPGVAMIIYRRLTREEHDVVESSRLKRNVLTGEEEMTVKTEIVL